MIMEAVDCEEQFARDALGQGVEGLTPDMIRAYLEVCADDRLRRLGMDEAYGRRTHPLDFMELQDIQELTNFFERRVSAYQTGVEGTVGFDEEF